MSPIAGVKFLSVKQESGARGCGIGCELKYAMSGMRCSLLTIRSSTMERFSAAACATRCFGVLR